MVYNDFLPPLRIVVNNECNGKCDFCHQEGNKNRSNLSRNILNECIKSINKLNIASVSLTGGEPTLCNELPQIINELSQKCKKTNLSLTTNGKNLYSIIPQIKFTIYGVNLSMVSFDSAIAADYQNVNPRDALNGLELFPAHNKNLNIMILEQNYMEFDKWVEFCINKEYDLDLMFLVRPDSKYQEIQRYIMNKLARMGEAQIVLRSTPIMRLGISEKNYIRVKHPFFSKLLQREMCKGCQQGEECFERVCAVRVYGNGLVSPCLSNYVTELHEGNISERIEAVYRKLENISGIYEFIL